MSKRDFYEVLNLTPTCNLNEVRQSYRKLALKWHPDKCLDKINSEQMFGEIQEAYSVLSNDRKKEIYDNYGHEGLELELNCCDDSAGDKKNFFFQKGFQGTDKSAFDVLQDIFKDNDDDCFFQNFDSLGISDNLKSSIKSFIDTNVFCHEKETGSNFFETYKPTFVNPEFFMAPPMFGNSENDESCTTHFFSSFVSNAGEKAFSRTSTTVFVNCKATTSTKDTYQSGNNIFEQQDFSEFDPKKSDLNYDKLFDSMFGGGNASDIIILDEAENNNDDDPFNTLFDVFSDLKSFANNKFQVLSIHENSKVSSASKKIAKEKDASNMRLTNKKPSKKAKV